MSGKKAVGVNKPGGQLSGEHLSDLILFKLNMLAVFVQSSGSNTYILIPRIHKS